MIYCYYEVVIQTEVYLYMVRHIILWKLKDEYSVEVKQSIKLNIKTALEGLSGIGNRESNP